MILVRTASRAVVLSVLCASSASFAQTQGVNPFFAVRPEVFTTSAGNDVELMVSIRAASGGTLSTADGWQFRFDQTQSVLVSAVDKQVFLDVGSQSALVPGDFTVTSDAGVVQITYNFSAGADKFMATGESISLRLFIRPQKAPASSPVAFISFNKVTTIASATSDTLSFVDFAIGQVGPRGPAGPAGPMGAAGQTGSAGPMGPAGQAGQSVVSSSEPIGPNCATGGIKFVSASGTAYACNGAAGAAGSPGSQGSQGPAGVAGAQGPAGSAGAQGPPGAPGIQGPPGPSGAPGMPGASGAPGQSVIGVAELPGVNCPHGGVKYVSVAGTDYVCDGAAGPAGAGGPAGAPGPAGASVISTLEPAGTNCANGGVKLVSATGTAYVCNGANGSAGTNGAMGAPGTAKGGCSTRPSDTQPATLLLSGLSLALFSARKKRAGLALGRATM